MKQHIRKPQQPHPQHKKTLGEKKIPVSAKKNSLVLPLIIVFCLPVLLYLQTIKFGFTNFDDDGLITSNITFLSHLGNAPHAFLTDAFLVKSSPFYRPLQTLSYMIDIRLSGINKTWMFHFSNLLLLGFIACSLFLLLKRLLIPTRLAVLGALIYCAHPLFVFTVAYIPTRGELLLTLFSTLSFLFFIDFLQKKKVMHLLLSWAAFTMALFCKETAALIPLLFIIYFFAFHYIKPFDKKYILIIILFAVSGIFWYWMRSIALSGCSYSNGVYGIAAIMLNVRIIPESLFKFFLLYDIVPIPSFSLFKTIVGAVILAIIIMLLFKSERPVKEKIFCLAWFLILISPPMFYKHPFMDYLDHRFFLPLIGILIFLLFIFPKKWLVKGDIRRSWILIAVLLLLCSFTFVKSGSYSDPMTFYNSAVSQNQNSAIAHNNRGVIENDRNDFQKALDDFNKAIALCPRYAEADYNIGNALRSTGDFKGAIEAYDKAIALRSNYAEAYNNKGACLGSTGNFNEAIINFNKALSIDPNYLSAYINRAVTFYSLKNYAGVIADCETMLKINPADENARKLKEKAMQYLQKTSH